ncbi:MAG: ferritin family protein, partial [Chloroflexota bacterium]
METKLDDQFNSLQGILNFAINKEQEAIDFYTNIADKVKSKSLVEELQKIAAMETGHRDRLKKLDPANII